MIETAVKRSIAEVIMQGDGWYDELIKVNNLGDGTYLVYEKTKIYGHFEGFARVHRLDPNKKTKLCGAYCSYYQRHSDSNIMRTLNDLIMPDME